MSEVKLELNSNPCLQLTIPSVKDLLFAYARAHGFEPLGETALSLEGDTATIQVMMSRQVSKQEKPVTDLSQESLRIHLD